MCSISTVKRRWRRVLWGRQLKKVFNFIDKKVVNFFDEKVHPGDVAGGFSDLEMTWLLYCADAASATRRYNALHYCTFTFTFILPVRLMLQHRWLAMFVYHVLHMWCLLACELCASDDIDSASRDLAFFPLLTIPRFRYMLTAVARMTQGRLCSTTFHFFPQSSH